MRVTRYEPWGLLNQFYKDLEQLYAHGNTDEESTVATSAWVPAVDIKEESDRFVIHADIPGVDPKDIEITMERGVLTIKGERRVETEEEQKGYRRVERVRGTFHRRFSLPETADPEGISAKGKHGVLEIAIPKRAISQPRRIDISVTE